ncbi:hypothetical protein KGA66_06200 [Actinocrinis puniceicyclus]|uniref:Core-binding (CB) domain-containing protein n=1 Tax=Actinocrinis puniceicyclus TaxID=977794 RepID=A0A8J8BC08_9ACTN|nr:hypothetical protein [Actinocrinis puniceicyclus]MBS2962631.1 hypothetical protein [Actinocrinis puniceicyclus]
MGRGKQRPIAEQRGQGEYTWRVKWPTPRRSPKTGRILYDQASGFATEDDAMDHGWEQLAKMRLGRYTDPRKAATPLEDWVAIWLDAQPHSAKTASTRRRYLRNFILPEFGHTALADINRFVVRTWAGRMTCAEVTRNHVVGLLSTILSAAADAGMIDANPIFRLKLSKAGAQRAAVMRETERVWALPQQAVPIAQRLWDCGRRGDALMVLTAAFAGLRYGELTALHVDNCCLMRRDELDGRPWARYVIRIDPQVGALHETTELDEQGVERTRLYLGPPKPPNGAREVDVPAFLAELLIEHGARVRARAEALGQRDPARGLMFVTPRGCLWRRSNWSGVMRPACDGRPARPRRRGTAGAAAWEPLVPGLELHGLRHGHSTAMEEDEIADVLRDQVMGHEVPKERREMRKRYTHVSAVMRRKRLDALTARWEKVGGLQLGAAA